jgi:glycosyltransferase involved in cell wall biosynthesis
LEAFSLAEHRHTKKLLFVYHPQGDFVRKILEADAAQHPEVAVSHRAHLEEIALNEGDRVRDEILLADGVACASRFTAASVRAVAGAPHVVSVIPYGCFADAAGSAISAIRPKLAKPQVLFVGQGTQRKGLHHLLKVWARGLFRDAELTLVVNNMDPGIAKLIDQLAAKPRLLQGLTKQQLQAEYERADVFLLPSLVEGFGLVYLEALSAGCHVIGTTNTGLPDLEAPSESASLVAPGNLDELQATLQRSIQAAASVGFDRAAIRRFAATRTWENFRQGIRDFVSEAEAAAK